MVFSITPFFHSPEIHRGTTLIPASNDADTFMRNAHQTSQPTYIDPDDLFQISVQPRSSGGKFDDLSERKGTRSR